MGEGTKGGERKVGEWRKIYSSIKTIEKNKMKQLNYFSFFHEKEKSFLNKHPKQKIIAILWVSCESTDFSNCLHR